MEHPVVVLEAKRDKLYRQLQALGDFRRGSISANYRKCGKRNCACAQTGHPGHGPQYLWNATIAGRSQAQNLPLGPALEKVRRETENYRTFQRCCEGLVKVNEELCRLRPTPVPADENELEVLKKKLRKRFSRKSRRK